MDEATESEAVRREITDEELHEAAMEVRRHARKEQVAMGGAILTVLGFFVICYYAVFSAFDDVSPKIMIGILVAGFALGGATLKALTPKRRDDF